MGHDAAPRDDEIGKLDARSIELMRRVKRGDHEAFRELVELHQQAVVGTCAKMLGNSEDGHDVAQQVFLRIWRAAPRYEATARFTTWLFTILRNLVFNEIRRRSRRPTVSLDEPVGAGESPRLREVPDSCAASPDSVMLEEELQRTIDRAIQELPESQRLAVVLRRYEEMPYEEIARILKTTVPSVKSLLFRARTQLRSSLRGYLSPD